MLPSPRQAAAGFSGARHLQDCATVAAGPRWALLASHQARCCTLLICLKSQAALLPACPLLLLCDPQGILKVPFTVECKAKASTARAGDCHMCAPAGAAASLWLASCLHACPPALLAMARLAEWRTRQT